MVRTIFSVVLALIGSLAADVAGAQTMVTGKQCAVKMVAGPDGNTCMQLQPGCSVSVAEVARAKFVPPAGKDQKVNVEGGALTVCKSADARGSTEGTVVTLDPSGRKYTYSEKSGRFTAAVVKKQ